MRLQTVESLSEIVCTPHVNLLGLIMLIQTVDWWCEVNYHGEGDNQFPRVISQRITLELAR